MLYNPYEVALDSSNNVYIADTFNYRIREVLSYAAPTIGSLSSTAWTVNQSGYTGLQRDLCFSQVSRFRRKIGIANARFGGRQVGQLRSGEVDGGHDI